MSVIPVSTRRMIWFHFELIVKFFLWFELQENIVAIALRADPEAMSVQIGGIKTMWVIRIENIIWAGCCGFRGQLVIQMYIKGFSLFDPNLGPDQPVFDIFTCFFLIKSTGLGHIATEHQLIPCSFSGVIQLIRFIRDDQFVFAFGIFL